MQRSWHKIEDGTNDSEEGVKLEPELYLEK